MIEIRRKNEERNNRGKILNVLVVVLVIIFFFSFLTYLISDKSITPRPQQSLQGTLYYFFKDIPAVKWVVYNKKQVYVGFDANFDPERPDPLKLIMGNAAREASMAGYRKIELWAVDANRTDRSWRPESGIEAWMLTKITYNGPVIHVQ